MISGIIELGNVHLIQ